MYGSNGCCGVDTELAQESRCRCDLLFYWAIVYYGQGGDALTVYLDLVMILNFLVDFLLLMGSSRLSGFPLEIRRLLLAAGLGAVYSGVCMRPGFRFLGNVLWRTVCLVLMSAMAFGVNRGALKRGGIFVILSMALGGIALSFGKTDFLGLLLAAACIWILSHISFGDRIGGREYANVTLTYEGKTATVVALRDTGNGLKDPVTGESVLVISGDVASRLTGLSQSQIASPMETVMQRPVAGLRLIPFCSVGNAGGMLLALPFDDCAIDGIRRRTLVAFAPDGLGRGEVYQALTGGAI